MELRKKNSVNLGPNLDLIKTPKNRKIDFQWGWNVDVDVEVSLKDTPRKSTIMLFLSLCIIKMLPMFTSCSGTHSTVLSSLTHQRLQVSLSFQLRKT